MVKVHGIGNVECYFSLKLAGGYHTPDFPRALTKRLKTHLALAGKGMPRDNSRIRTDYTKYLLLKEITENSDMNHWPCWGW